jgi:hypothetical protein
MQDRGFRGKNHNLQKYNGPALIQGGPTLSDSVSLTERELRKRVSLERRDEPKLPAKDEKFLRSQAPMFPCLPTCNFGSHGKKILPKSTTEKCAVRQGSLATGYFCFRFIS